MKNWLKVLGAALIMYSILAGILMPLGAGISDISKARANAGEQITIDIEGYNTHFLSNETENKLFLKVDSFYIEPQSVEVKSEQLIGATFALPKGLPADGKVKEASVIVHNSEDGFAIMPSAIYITNQQGTTADRAGWTLHAARDLKDDSRLDIPYRAILLESIRNNYFHVPMWFALIILMGFSAFYSFKYVRHQESRFDQKALAFAQIGFLLGLLGILTGSIWAKHTWGAYWSWDIKQNMAAIALLMYAAYFILRSSMSDPDGSARISGAYNLFAFAMLIPLLFIIPRMTESLHPGNGGNPGFGGEDLDNTMRMVFYPAVMGWILFGFWMSDLKFRQLRLAQKFIDNTFE